MKKKDAFEFDMDSPFVTEMGVFLNVNGNQMPKGLYNLICSKREVGLFCKGIMPRRGWRLKDTKLYYGIKGNKHKTLAHINWMYDYLMGDIEEEIKKTGA